jgi:PhnB protein
MEDSVAAVSTYLNFAGNTEEAFEFYKSVFGTEYDGQIYRMGDFPAEEGHAELSDAAKNLVMHVSLPILGGHRLMGTDTVDELGMVLNVGDNVSIMLQPDSREDADRLFAALSPGGNVSMPMADQVWGDYFGSFTDKYGVSWMINYSAAA